MVPFIKNFEQKLRDLEEKQTTLKSCLQGVQILKVQKREEFITYEEWKVRNPGKIYNLAKSRSVSSLGNAKTNENRDFVDSILK